MASEYAAIPSGTAVCMHIGSAYVLAGASGEDAPRVRVPNVVCDAVITEAGPEEDVPDDKGGSGSGGDKSLGGVFLVGDAARERALATGERLKHPVEHGVVTDWDAMAQVVRHVYADELHVPDASNHPLMVSETPLNPKANRERMCQLAFEELNVPRYSTCSGPTLALYASGRTTGVVVSAGATVTHVTPICEGYTLPHAVRRMDRGGDDLDSFLGLLLRERGFNISTTRDRDVARDIRERLSFIAPDFSKALDAARGAGAGAGAGSGDKDDAGETGKADHEDVRYELPDGQVLSVGYTGRFKAPEALFSPALLGSSAPGLVHSISSAIGLCDDVSVRRSMYGNIVLEGGLSRTRGMKERIEADLNREVGRDFAVQVIAVEPAGMPDMVFIGASILTGLDTFADMWVTKADYDEHGPGFIHKRAVL